jgi:hypothetical protein
MTPPMIELPINNVVSTTEVNSTQAPKPKSSAETASFVARELTKAFYLRVVFVFVFSLCGLVFIFSLPANNNAGHQVVNSIFRTTSLCSLSIGLGLCVPCVIFVVSDSLHLGVVSQSTEGKWGFLFLPSQKVITIVVQVIVLLTVFVPNCVLLSDFIHTESPSPGSYQNFSFYLIVCHAQIVVVLNTIVSFSLQSLTQHFKFAFWPILLTCQTVLFILHCAVQLKSFSSSVTNILTYMMLFAFLATLSCVAVTTIKLWRDKFIKVQEFSGDEVAALSLLTACTTWLLLCCVVEGLSLFGKITSQVSISMYALLLALLAMSLSIVAIEKSKLREEEAEVCLTDLF